LTLSALTLRAVVSVVVNQDTPEVDKIVPVSNTICSLQCTFVPLQSLATLSEVCAFGM